MYKSSREIFNYAQSAFFFIALYFNWKLIKHHRRTTRERPPRHLRHLVVKNDCVRFLIEVKGWLNIYPAPAGTDGQETDPCW